MSDVIEVETPVGMLHVRHHRCEDDQSRSAQRRKSLVWIHGLGEHGGRYEHLCHEMTSRGWNIITPDLRGHGKSAGTRTHVRTFDEYAQDLAAIWNQLELSKGDTVLGAHSMGGLIALRAVQCGLVKPSALVLTSPLLGIRLHVSPLKKALGKLLVGVYPKARFRNGLDPRNMTRDPSFTRERNADPLIVKTVTASWFFAMQAVMKQVHRDAHLLNTPLLAICGEDDRTTDTEALRAWLERVSSPRRNLIVLPDHVHEMMHETDWLETLNHVMNWLNQTPKDADRGGP
jgi:alpha-beta hydrolase superfamily lysophospholipase